MELLLGFLLSALCVIFVYLIAKESDFFNRIKESTPSIVALVLIILLTVFLIFKLPYLALTISFVCLIPLGMWVLYKSLKDNLNRDIKESQKQSMAYLSIEKLADDVGISVDCLIQQFKESGVTKIATDIVTEEEK